jgi:hypothetical protein
MYHRRSVVVAQTNKPSVVFRRVACTVVTLLCISTLSVASAEDASLKDGAKRAGHAIGTAARDVGQGAKKVGKAVGKAAKEGGREFRRAIKGESH